jgi:hypothetical protein
MSLIQCASYCETRFRQLKILWSKHRILDAARISDVLRGRLNFGNARFRRVLMLPLYEVAIGSNETELR